MRRFLVILTFVAVFLSIGISVFYFELTPYPAQDPFVRKATYEAYGFRIEYPVGASFGRSPINSTLGLVEWAWNFTPERGGETILCLEWQNGTVSPFYPSRPAYLWQNYDTLMYSGNTTIGGVIWSYRTYLCTNGSNPCYETAATRFYSTENRTYTIIYLNSLDNTLSQVDSWGTTFNG